MSRGPDAATLLLRAIDRHATLAGCPARCVSSDWTRWASATFAGARHVLTLSAAASPALDRWIADLPETELVVPGHCVAEILVTACRHARDGTLLTIEALTVEV